MMLRFLAPLLLLCPAAFAQPLPDLITDRPDFTESAVVVPLGHVQVEAGATLAFDDETETLSGPELLVRWTPVERIELRFGAPDYVEGENVSGFADPSLGLKAQFGPLNDWDLGLIATLSFPLGDEALSSDSVDPEIIATMGRDLSEHVGIGGQVLAARDGSTNLWTVGGAFVITFARLHSIPATFFEFVALAPDGRDSEVILNNGYTVLFGRNVQLDAYAGIGLTDAAPDLVIGAGLTVRR